MPNTDVDFQASPEFDSAVDARQQAVLDRREAVADRNAAIAALNDLGVEVDPADLTKSKIDTTIDDLIDDVREDRSLTPDEVAERVDALRELRETAWNERESFVGQVNASEAMGDAGARDAIRSQGADVVVDGRGASAGQFDQVGLTRDGSTLIVAEAKGGTADLSSSGRLLPDGSRVPQGSTAYFNEVFRLDPTLQQWLADNPAIARGLLDRDIDIRYQLVRTDGNGVVRIEDLALDARSLDLQGEGMPARQPELIAAGGVRADAGAPTVVDTIVQDTLGPADSSSSRDHSVEAVGAARAEHSPGDAGGPHETTPGSHFGGYEHDAVGPSESQGATLSDDLVEPGEERLPALGRVVSVGAVDVYVPRDIRIELGDPPYAVRSHENGTSSLPLTDYAEMRASSVHNAQASELVLGRYVAGSDTSYIEVARRAGSTYFDMGNDGWERGTRGFGLSADDMFNFFNRPVLDAALMDGKTIRFTHDPNADRASFLFREARYIEQFGYDIVPDGNGAWIASR
jgi:hypothetical protein